MTALMPERAEVVELTRDDLRAAVRCALADAGHSFDELAEQAEANDFDSVVSRLAWITVRNHRDLAGDAD